MLFHNLTKLIFFWAPRGSNLRFRHEGLWKLGFTVLLGPRFRIKFRLCKGGFTLFYKRQKSLSAKCEWIFFPYFWLKNKKQKHKTTKFTVTNKQKLSITHVIN